MRGGILAAFAVPVAALLLVAGGGSDAPPAAEARDIDRALAQAEADLARAEANEGWRATGT